MRSLKYLKQTAEIKTDEKTLEKTCVVSSVYESWEFGDAVTFGAAVAMVIANNDAIDFFPTLQEQSQQWGDVSFYQALTMTISLVGSKTIYGLSMQAGLKSPPIYSEPEKMDNPQIRNSQ